MTDQTTPLRDRIAAALYAHDHPHRVVQLDETGMGPAYRETADEVLAVLPAPVDRAAVLREAADIAEAQRQFEPAYGARKSAQISENVGILRVADELRRAADETATTETQAATLTPAERTMLGYALDQAQERIWSEDGFTDEDQAAVDSLRRLTAEQPAAGARQDGADRG